MRSLMLLAALAALLAGCVQEEPIGGEKDEHGCLIAAGYSWCEVRGECLRAWETPCRLTLEEALSVAWGSECMAEGKVTGADAAFNNNSNTWWLTLEANRSGCNPACVVYENRSAEVNWRCTGALPPGDLTESEARAIAEGSLCMQEGNLTGVSSHNDYTRTWWFDMDTKKEGCAPACVVDEETLQAEVNWRCTGLLPG